MNKVSYNDFQGFLLENNLNNIERKHKVYNFFRYCYKKCTKILYYTNLIPHFMKLNFRVSIPFNLKHRYMHKLDENVLTFYWGIHKLKDRYK